MKKRTNEFDTVMALSKDLSRYIGQWIALVDDRIVASGTSGKEVYLRAVEECPNREPFIMKVPRNEIMLL